MTSGVAGGRDDRPSTTSPEERAELLALARATVRAVASGGPMPDARGGEVMDRPGGAFVTLRTASNGALRGCIGHFHGFGRLGETITRMARAAASEDPRFPPVREDEVDELRIEISLLSPMRKAAADEVVPGRHGVYVRSGPFAGTLLPQVAEEEGWDRETLLAHTCLKAGLPPDCWRTGGAEIFVYTAEVFGEEDARAD